MLKRESYYKEEETCFKPIGELAQVIENTSLADWALFVVYGPQMIAAQQSLMGEAVIIGFNDQDNMKTKLKTFRLHWIGGKIEIVTGINIARAFSNAGYGRGALPALDYYETL